MIGNDKKHSQMLSLHNCSNGFPLYGKVPTHSESLLAWEYIPATAGISYSNTIACTFNGGSL